ncbi:hypothetical protein TNCV_1197671 [Trichonephila clavipes]|uniref:Uncharacterized protein n=1 Tax=Trichonephila clavipes TaxID=2585209 RepID=A0A8X6S381_TRICX|nr:hypothetical protein TNCV_1197671 [Trichonephila clavipes]
MHATNVRSCLDSSKKQHFAIHAPKFVIDSTCVYPVCDKESRVDTAMVSKLRNNAAANVVEMFVRTLVVLQTTPVLHSRP